MILYLPLLALLVYAPSLEGPPLWDDNYFIFWRYHFQGTAPLATVWKAHLWPLFDTTAQLLYSLWGERAWAWRFLNLTLHTLNAYGLSRLIASWRPQWRWPLLLLFLVHPLNVMSVAFIIQLKTLMAASFLLLSWALWQRWEKRNQTWALALSGVSFAASLASKSSGLPFPAIALLGFLCTGLLTRRRGLALIPFFILSGLSLYRISRDPKIERITAHTEKTLVPVAPTLAPTLAPTPTPAPAIAPQPAPVPQSASPVPPSTPSRPTRKFELVLHNLGNYFSYPWWPWPLSLSHGVFQGAWSLKAIFGAVGLTALSCWSLLRRRWSLLFLVLGQVLALIPFLGFVVAPYMSYTSISEQHLYFALPFALLLQLHVLAQLPQWICQRALVGLLLVLGVLSFQYNYAYRSEEALFQRVLAERPHDLFAQINLAATWARTGQTRRAFLYLEARLKEAEADPRLRQDNLLQMLRKARDAYRSQSF